MVALSVILLSGLKLQTVDAHYGLMIPATWTNSGKWKAVQPMVGRRSCDVGCHGRVHKDESVGRKFDQIENVGGCNCQWYTNFTKVSANDDQPIRCPGSGASLPRMCTYGMQTRGDWWTKNRMPWSAPGKAPVNSPCGVDGANLHGCWTGTGIPNAPGNTEVQCGPGGYGQGPDARFRDFGSVPVTVWPAGSVQEAAWGVDVNHGGGYAYRLCKMGRNGPKGVTEECFRQGHLDFAEKGVSYLRRWDPVKASEEKTIVTTDVNTWSGDTGPWKKNPIPACENWLGTGEEGCKTWFPAPRNATRLYGYGYHLIMGKQGYAEAMNWLVIDKLQIPSELTEGYYVLSYRHDSQQTPQVWFGCATIQVTSSIKSTVTSAMEKPGCQYLSQGLYACDGACPKDSVIIDQNYRCEQYAVTMGKTFKKGAWAHVPKGCSILNGVYHFSTATEGHQSAGFKKVCRPRAKMGSLGNLWPDDEPLEGKVYVPDTPAEGEVAEPEPEHEAEQTTFRIYVLGTKHSNTRRLNKYFNFNLPRQLKSTLDDNSAGTAHVRQCRGQTQIWEGSITFWNRRNDAQVAGTDSHGRRKTGHGANQFQTGDVLTDEPSCASQLLVQNVSANQKLSTKMSRQITMAVDDVGSVDQL